MATAPLPSSSLSPEDVAAFLRANPHFLAEHLDLYRVLAPPQRVHGDVLAVWKANYATDAWGGPLPCGHYVPEEAPDETYAKFIEHFKG